MTAPTNAASSTFSSENHAVLATAHLKLCIFCGSPRLHNCKECLDRNAVCYINAMKIGILTVAKVICLVRRRLK